MRVKSNDGMVQSGWIASLAALVGALLHKGIPLINETFGYEAWIPLFTAVTVGIYMEIRGKKKKE